MRRYVVSLALVDPASKKWWLFEATPDIKYQLHYFQTLTKGQYNFLPDGIFITHAHIGHYTGLMDLGKEVMSTHDVPVYVLPKLKQYLETNGPWSQLVSLHNIKLTELKEDQHQRGGDEALYLSAITVGELRKGLDLAPFGKRRSQLEDWFEFDLIPTFEDRILPVTRAIAERWGALSAQRHRSGRPLSMADGLIAATALEHSLILVTRNTKDFDQLGVTLRNPWDSLWPSALRPVEPFL